MLASAGNTVAQGRDLLKAPADLRARLGAEDPGAEMHALAGRLYPFCRSLTGNGVRETLAVLREGLPIEIHEVPSGTAVLDWTVPKEWNIRDAWIKDSRGEKVVDFKKSNLHVVGYSVPVRAVLPLSELRPRLHSLPDQPDRIPYRNSFYKEDWGFCLPHRQLEALPEGDYEVCIDSTLADGSLTYGELVLPGKEEGEILVSCHVCHPSLANDNLSGMVVSAMAARYLARVPRRHTFRFLFVPVTIGSIAWLARNEAGLGRIRHGLVLTLLGDPGTTTYKRSRRGDAAVDRAARHVLAHAGAPHQVQDFFPYGYDERQYCSPGFDLPVGTLMRTPHGRFPEYHNSGDDLDFIRPECLEDSLAKALAILDVLEGDRRYANLFPKGEPQLGRRGVFASMAERRHEGVTDMAVFWTLNLCDGSRSLLEVAERAGMPFSVIRAAAEILAGHGILAELPEGGGGKGGTT